MTLDRKTRPCGNEMITGNGKGGRFEPYAMVLGIWHRRACASKKIGSFPGRLIFSEAFLLFFLCVLFGVIDKFRIFAHSKGCCNNLFSLVYKCE